MGSVLSGGAPLGHYFEYVGGPGEEMVPRGSLFEHVWGSRSKRGDNGIIFLSCLGTLGEKMVPLGSVFDILAALGANMVTWGHALEYFGDPWMQNGGK